MNTSKPIRVLIADDHPLLRSGIAAVLTSDPHFTVVAEAEDGHAAVEQFELHRPDITLMDLQMPGLNGVEATQAIRQINPRALIIILTTFNGDVQVTRSLRAGASGYILKNLARTDLCDYLISIHAGQRLLPPQVARSLASSFHAESLSKREVEVLRLVAAGNSNQKVGVELGLREDTIKAHMKAILLKLDARDRTHAVTIALRRGFWES
jgi:DNA-binding NarL/FixJ family response regulator